MVDASPTITTWSASDGYPIHVATWLPDVSSTPLRGRILVLHGVQSHGGWYHDLGRTLAERGYETHFTDRRGSGANRKDRGHTPTTRRLLDDVGEYLSTLMSADPTVPVGLVGISWGGKLAVVTAGKRPDLVAAVALVCPGLQPRVGVSFRERLRIALAYFFQPRKTFPIPLSDPALFTANLAGQAFIARDPLGLRAASATLLAASAFLDRQVARIPKRVRQPALLMLADQDQIVDNERTLAYWRRISSTRKAVIRYPSGHHTLEFDADPSRYARDLATWFDQALVPDPAR